jgi:cytoskeletal protein CcmA (bactofilin family)
MALFNKANKSGEAEAYFSTATIVTQGTINVGNFIGDDSIHIDGKVEGDIKVNNVVIIGRRGIVNGNIKAEQVISSGRCTGNILCDSLELLESSKTQGHVKSNKVLLKGDIQGNIICGGLFMSKEAFLESTVQAKSVVADGTITGTIACRELKIMSSSFIKGNMFADRIINKGGHVEGYIGKYKDLVGENPKLAQYSSIFNSTDNTMLLSHKDYKVNVEEEVEHRKSGVNELEYNEEFFVDVEFDESDDKYAEVCM